ncbi:ribokinase [Arenibaculum sp.]|uniref:ribokinase n=1 Tax=Arenibaculum sp. TaxID=2865862 RepID=UPI002E122A59|nr:ribokinase [Arenibaculum sp.]
MIVVFGSLNVDLVMAVPALPRPGETVLCPGYLLKPGGKGANQAVAARRAGAEVAMAGRIGEDDFGRVLRAVLDGEGIDADAVAPCARPTGCAAICVDAGGENAIAVASGANLDAAADQVPDRLLGPGATVLMQMEVPAAQNWALVRRARGRGARTILNAAPAAAVPDEVLSALDLLVVNGIEVVEVARRAGIAAADEVALARAVAARHATTVVVTRGRAGAVAALPDGAVWTVGVLPVAAVDTTGAGDAFCGVLAASLDAGHPLPAALARAAVGAGLACTALGAQESLPHAAVIDARLADLPAPSLLT